MNDEIKPVGQSPEDSLFEHTYGCTGIIALNLFGIPIIAGSIDEFPAFIETMKSADTFEKILAIGLAGLVGIIDVGTVTIDLQALRLLLRGDSTTK